MWILKDPISTPISTPRQAIQTPVYCFLLVSNLPYKSTFHCEGILQFLIHAYAISMFPHHFVYFNEFSTCFAYSCIYCINHLAIKQLSIHIFRYPCVSTFLSPIIQTNSTFIGFLELTCSSYIT